MPDPDPQAFEADAALRKGIYHFLDVGDTKYGDCILVEFGDIRVLIDGSHIGDFKGQAGHLSVPQQLQAILGGQPPFDISLLVVTHCHADHIGCLPQLVENNIITPKFALLTDPDVGFGRIGGGGFDGFSDLSGDEVRRKLAAALREEDASDMNDDALEAFIDAAATAESRYADLIANLTANGVTIVRYTGDPLPAALTRVMRPTGMRVLGPSRRQLDLCAAQIAKTNDDASDMADSLRADAPNLVSLYRNAGSMLDAGGGGRGAGMNCQSITLAFGGKKDRALLAGDMQFAESGVKGADAEMAALRAAVAAHGPYKLFKTTHHSAHNGQDDALMTAIGNPPVLVHSGGANDSGHPNRDVLAMLKARQSSIQFWRTDRNGLISVTPHLFPGAGAVKATGAANDFSPNVRDDAERTEATSGKAASTAMVEAQSVAPASGPQVIIVNLPPNPVSMSVGGVSIVVDSLGGAPAIIVPRGFGIETKSAKSADTIRPGRLGGARDLPKLLFVTVKERLARNIGASETEAALATIRNAGKPLIEVRPGSELEDTRAALQADPSIEGVVLLGGYDVVPSIPTDSIDPALREKLGGFAEREHDQFIVWSDDRYGDTDGDHFAELPVSRIPDARDAALVMAALQAGAPVANDRFGIRNVARPFADQVWQVVQGQRPLHVSEEFLSDHVDPAVLSGSLNYMMLHGRDTDGRKFEGEFEGENGEYPVALEIRSIPASMNGIVFAGCCWGALIVSEKACDIGSASPAPRMAERSIALSYLKAGASAFVGCTGAHYSGTGVTPDDNAALVFHSAFWEIAKSLGYQAAPSLFAARKYFFEEFIDSRADSIDPRMLAVMLKNRTQFTCLGLGW